MKGASMNLERKIHLHGPFGQRQFREVLGVQMAGLLLSPEPVWLVAASLSDFPVLDNRGGRWDALEPAWGSREIGFTELLARVVNGGCSLRIVAERGVVTTATFITYLKHRLLIGADCRVSLVDEVRPRILLARHWAFEGMETFAFSATHKNKAEVCLTRDLDKVAGLFALFEQDYPLEAVGR